MHLADRYPSLFGLIDTPEETGQFELLDVAPPFELVGRALILPVVGDRYAYLLDPDGAPRLPGGLLDPGEMPRDALARCLAAEAAMAPVDAALFGGWHVHRKTDQPPAPHIPHPQMWTLVYTGAVEAKGERAPAGLAPGPEVHVMTLDEVVAVFRTAEREDLAELYWLVDEKRRGLL